MSMIMLQLVPVLLLLGLGAFAAWRKIITAESRDFLLRLLFLLIVPALVLDNVPKAHLTATTWRLPVAIWLIALATMVVAMVVARLVTSDRRKQGVLVVGSMILNSGFVLPFVLATQGSDGIARFQLMDVGNGIITFSLIYWLAAWYGQQRPQLWTSFRRLLSSPPLWALVISLIMLATKASLPGVLSQAVHQLGLLTGPVILLALGASINLRASFHRLVFIGVAMSLGLGILLSRLVAAGLQIQGIDRGLILLVGFAPVGYNTLVFAGRENLDKELASAIVSWSLLLSVVIIPIAMVLMNR